MLQESRAMFHRVRDSGTVSPFSRCPPARGGGTPPPAVAPCGPDRTVCIRKAVVQLCCTVKDVPWVKKFFQKKRRKRLTEGGHFDRPLFAPTSASFPGGSIGRAGDCYSLGWRFKSVPGSQKVQGLTAKAVGPFLFSGAMPPSVLSALCDDEAPDAGIGSILFFLRKWSHKFPPPHNSLLHVL